MYSISFKVYVFSLSLYVIPTICDPNIINKRNMAKLGVVDLFEVITLFEEGDYCNADNEEVSLFIGATRSGKSTTVNLFLDNSLKVKLDDDPEIPRMNRKILLVSERENVGKFPVIGTKTVSESSLPMKYKMKNGGILWDCPGFGDSRGPQQEIFNAWFINRLFETAKGVKLINIFSAEALVQTNVLEFRAYIQQIKDLFGLENISSLTQILIFTKVDGKNSVTDLMQSFMYLLKEHFPTSEYQELHDFFNKAKVIKMEKPGLEDVGKIMTQNDIPELIRVHNVMAYQKLKPHVAVDTSAKNFLYQSISELSVVASNIKNAYIKAYQGEIKDQLENIFKTQCMEKDLIKLSEQFTEATQCSKELSDDAVNNEEKLLKRIIDFVLKIIPDETAFQSTAEKEMKYVKHYNELVLNYNANVKFLKFLKNHSKKITGTDIFHKAWNDQIVRLAKPEIGDLSHNFEELLRKSVENNVNIILLNEQVKLEVEKNLSIHYVKENEIAQNKYNSEIKEYLVKLSSASKPSAWIIIPILGPSIDGLIKRFQVDLTIPELKVPTVQTVCTILDRSFSHYLTEKDHLLLGDIVHDYWEQ